MNEPVWVREHREAWTRKTALPAWYQSEIFARLDRALSPGLTLQLGYGPGFYGGKKQNFVNVDISKVTGVAAVCDVHGLPFRAGIFANVVGVDVLHHFAQPGRALAEISRVLSPQGRCLLIEPWAGPLGWIVYRFLHHEDCRAVERPWTAAYEGEKSAMDGNAWIPRALLWQRAAELPVHAPGLRIARVEAFGGLGYLATGGFGSFGAPARVVRVLTAIESGIPQFLARATALRVFFVLERERGVGA